MFHTQDKAKKRFSKIRKKVDNNSEVVGRFGFIDGR